MAFQVAQETLQALEWTRVVALLCDHCFTPQARSALQATGSSQEDDVDDEVDDSSGSESQAAERRRSRPQFVSTLTEARQRLEQTSEARTMLDEEQSPPLGGAEDLSRCLRRAEQAAVLEIQEMVSIRGTLNTLHATAHYLEARADAAPLLADLASTIEDHRALEHEIDHCIDAAGEVKDAASPALAGARRDCVRLASDLQNRLARYLQNPDIKSHLSDGYYTLRNDRYVLPVRADAKSKVRGIVHDASRTGATLFIEPEGVVEINNRLKQAELTVTREIERVLRRLSQQVAQLAPSIRSALEALTTIDLAFARGRLSQQMNATLPEVGSEGVFELPGLRHPLLPREECVANDVRLGRDFSVLVLSGPNAGGKTVTMKAVALAALFIRAGLHVPCEPGARVDLMQTVVADIGDGQDIGESLSTFSAHMANLSRIVRAGGSDCLMVLDEIGVGTDPSEGAALGQAILEQLADADARVITTTHYNLLKEMAEVDPRFSNASVEFDPETLAPTYRIELGTPGASSAAAVAARMGMPGAVLERSDALMRREDRQLDRILTELASSRATLESEREQVAQLRAESEGVRDEYRSKLERLQEKRDALFASMRDDLDDAFKQAHAEVAGVIRDLQRGKSSQQAAKAREKLETLEARAEQAEAAAGIKRSKNRMPDLVPVDWSKIKPRQPVLIHGNREGTLLTLPDRRGRVSVQVGAAKLVLARENVGQASRAASEHERASSQERLSIERAEPSPAQATLAGGTLQCDLRGQRVDEALDHLSDMLDRASFEAKDALMIVHGHGTGALRKAVREHLAGSPYVATLRPGNKDEGGNGVTVCELR